MIQLIGDLALTGLYVDDPAHNARRLEKIRPLFENDALKFANLETPIFVENSQNPNKNKIHTTNKQALQEVLLALDIDVVSLANNHVYDCLKPGLEATIEALEECGIRFTGAGTKPEHIEPVYLEKYDQKIAFMAYVDLSTNPKTETYPDLFINYFDVEKVKKDIIEARKNSEVVICSLHWGRDYSYYPTQKQRQIAQMLIDSGGIYNHGASSTYHTTLRKTQKWTHSLQSRWIDFWRLHQKKQQIRGALQKNKNWSDCAN